MIRLRCFVSGASIIPDHKNATDGQLIAAAHGGDADAWRTLYQRWMPWVWRCAYSLVHDTHAAEDITSEAMTAWVRRLSESGGDAPQVAAWLRTVIRNKAADHHRRKSRSRKAMQEVALIAERRCVDDDPSIPSQESESQHQVTATLARLPENYRLALEWKYGQAMSVQAIATRIGSTEKSVEAVLYRARREFRRQYELLEAQEDHAPATNGAVTHAPPSASQSRT